MSKITDIKERLSIDDVESYVCNALGSEGCRPDGQGNLTFCTNICHGGDSYKLYYYPDSGSFFCFSHCGTIGDIFDLTAHVKGCDFNEAFSYVCNFFNLRSDGFGTGFIQQEKPLVDDWGILEKISDFSESKKEEVEEKVIPISMLDFYQEGNPAIWLEDGISIEAMRKYSIRIDVAGKRIIIPHFNINGELIGIRGRALDPEEIENHGKYAPVRIGKDGWMTHPLGTNLYGLCQAKENIKHLRKVCVAESEKACMQSYTMFGEANFTVATCGSSGLSQKQIDLLLDCGVEEIILAYDKEFHAGKEDEMKAYEEKLLKIVQPLTPLFNVSVLFDYDGLLDYKMSPFDAGVDVLLRLMKNKVRISSITDDTIKRREQNAKRKK